MIALVALSIVGGAAGWYWYFRTEARDQRAAQQATATPASPVPSAPAAATRAPATAAAPTEPDTAEPITLTAKDLREALAGHAPLTADEAYARIYQGREVTWSGRVSTVTRQQTLVKLDLVDDDGVRIVALCEPGRDVAAGQRVSLRGRVMTKLADGFVVERCELR